MTYLDSNYDNFMNRSSRYYPEGQTSLASASLIESISASKILSDGVITSQDGNLTIDLVNGIIQAKSGLFNFTMGGDKGISLTNLNGTEIIDSGGLISTNFDSNSSVIISDDYNEYDKSFSTNSVTFVDIPGMVLRTNDIKKPYKILVLIFMRQGITYSTYYSVTIEHRLYVDGAAQTKYADYYSFYEEGTERKWNEQPNNFVDYYILDLPPGPHELKLKTRISYYEGTLPSLIINTRSLSYMVLGS